MIPDPVLDPLRADFDSDPVLALARASAHSSFPSVIKAALERNPSIGESMARVDEALSARNEAGARMGPTIDIGFTHYEVVSRAFSNDPGNIVERSRQRRRTDAILNVDQPIFDFGAGRDRLRAAEQRLVSARFAVADTESQVALRAVGTWYNVFGYRALLALSTHFLESQRKLLVKLGHRVQQGYAAEADIVRLDGVMATTRSDVAEYRRRQETAEAQYDELVGQPAPGIIQRAPPPLLHYRSADEPQADSVQAPAVLAGQALARAVAREAKAARADELPQVTASTSVGRYGVFENARDYDARVTGGISWRLFGGAKQRAEQAEARSRGATLRAERILQETRRDAAIAFADLQALEESAQAGRESYIAARRSRDVVAQRFEVSRGTLFDLIAVEGGLYSAASRYILTLIELDTARYASLARTGRLIAALRLPDRGTRR